MSSSPSSSSAALSASRYSWCVVVEHLYEAAWASYLDNGGAGVKPSLRAALEEVVRVECVADMLSEMSSEVDVVVKMQKQVGCLLGKGRCIFS